jgi:serine/threonine-protein kinase
VARILAAAARLDDGMLDLERPAYERFATLWDEPTDEARFQRAIEERFVIEGEAGRGGMAIVYRARDMRDGRVVALKVVRTTAGARGAARFRREIALASRLAHPHILSPIDSGETGGRLWYTMPFIAGESLRARLDRGPVGHAESLTLLTQIASALEYAHAQGIVHRDLKPDNVLLSEGGAIIVDFGVAKAIITSEAADDREHSTATGVTLGTPAYMAPEQAAGQKAIDHRADLYAFGVMAWQLFTGVLPFTASSRQALLTAQLSERPDVNILRRHAVPTDLQSLVMRLLEKEAANRPVSTAEVRQRLEALAVNSMKDRTTRDAARRLRELWTRLSTVVFL